MAVSCKLYGRLGNQMFQIAAAIGAAISWGTDFLMPPQTENETIWPNYFKDIIPKAPYSPFEWREYKEFSHAYSQLKDVGQHTRIDGYFQSYRYFDFCINEVRNVFGLGNCNREKGVVSCHIRRGDYLSLQDKHPVVTEKYLDYAIKGFVEGGFQDVRLYSDDMDWAKWYGSRWHAVASIEYSENIDPMKDFRSMMNCSHNIVANSSFSVMAAILNPNPHKIVVCPSHSDYFGRANAHLPTHDIMPPNWHRIKY